MAPRDGGSTESNAGGSASSEEGVDWTWIDTLDPDGGESLPQYYHIPIDVLTIRYNINV